MYYNYFVFDGKPSTEFGLIISGASTWESSEYDVDTTEIPGRVGDIINADGRFKNFDVEYSDSAIASRFSERFPALRAYLMSHSNKYYRLEDTYHPEYYLMAKYEGALNPDYDAWNDAGTVDLKFNAEPQRWLKSGERTIEVASATSLKNPTMFTAKPLIRVHGIGRLTVGDISVDISSSYSNAYIDLDCDLCDAYYGDENCNKYITTTNYLFPELKGGELIRILYDSTITKVELTPRWWTL